MSPFVVRLGLGAMATSVAAVALYAVARALQLALVGEANPATVIWSAHAGFFWRAWTVLYAGGMAGFVAFLAAKRDPLRVARVLVRGLMVASGLLVLQSLFLP